MGPPSRWDLETFGPWGAGLGKSGAQTAVCQWLAALLGWDIGSGMWGCGVWGSSQSNQRKVWPNPWPRHRHPKICRDIRPSRLWYRVRKIFKGEFQTTRGKSSKYWSMSSHISCHSGLLVLKADLWKASLKISSVTLNMVWTALRRPGRPSNKNMLSLISKGNEKSSMGVVTGLREKKGVKSWGK